MQNSPKPFCTRGTTKAVDVFFVMVGVAGLMLKRQYSGPLEELVQSYGGNVAVSFAVYFISKQFPIHPGWEKIFTACLALGAVELFEAADGFGIMSNVYDPIDFVANAGGVALALALDTALGRKQQKPTIT